MIKSTQIARLDGLPLCASVDDEQADTALQDVKGQVRLVLRRLNRNSEPEASIECGQYTLQCVALYFLASKYFCSFSLTAITNHAYVPVLAATLFPLISPSSQLLRPHTHENLPSFTSLIFLQSFSRHTHHRSSTARACVHTLLQSSTLSFSAPRPPIRMRAPLRILIS